MLEITVGATESFDEAQGVFVQDGGVVLQLEHSLVSLSKWEAIHEKAFLGDSPKTSEELLSYVKCMLLPTNPPGEFLHKLSETNLQDINAYLNAKMTATWFSEQPGAPRSREVITSELIYYWMTVFNIPFECENWHLNRLFTLIRICNIKQSKPKKMSRAEIAARNRELNAQRKAQLGTRG
jgi:hypothetical protein